MDRLAGGEGCRVWCELADADDMHTVGLVMGFQAPRLAGPGQLPMRRSILSCSRPRFSRLAGARKYFTVNISTSISDCGHFANRV